MASLFLASNLEGFVTIDSDPGAIRRRLAEREGIDLAVIEGLDWSWLTAFRGHTCNRLVLIEAVRWRLRSTDWDAERLPPESLVEAMARGD